MSCVIVRIAGKHLLVRKSGMLWRFLLVLGISFEIGEKEYYSSVEQAPRFGRL